MDVRGCLLFALLISLLHSGAAVYYKLQVDPAGQDITACRTGIVNNIVQPNVSCKTIAYAINPVSTTDFLDLILAPGTYSGVGNVNLAITALRLNLNGTTASDGSNPTIDCGLTASALTITPQTNSYKISNINFQNCKSALGGAVNIQPAVGSAAVTFTNCIFSGNSATQNGGAIFSKSYQLDLVSCSFRNNSAGQNGGAVYVQEQGFSVSGSSFIGNTANLGGGIYTLNVGNPSTPTRIVSSVFMSNVVVNQGGAFFGQSDDIRLYDLTGSQFDDNCATDAYADSYEVQVRCASAQNCTITSKGTSTGCKDIATIVPPTPTNETKPKSNKDKAIIIGVVVPFAILAILSVALFVYIRRKHNAEMIKRDEYRRRILRALDNLPPEEQEAARREAENADPSAPKCKLCETRPLIPLPCGHEIVCSVCRTIVLECPTKGCKKPTR